MILTQVNTMSPTTCATNPGSRPTYQTITANHGVNMHGMLMYATCPILCGMILTALLITLNQSHV